MLGVVYDANVLYPASVRDLLIRLALTGLFAARWTEQILDEMIDALLRKQPELERARLERTRGLMCEAVPGCLVDGYEGLIDDLELPDADDRHVLAAAIHCGADVIVTANLADFPPPITAAYGIEVIHPDDFVGSLIEGAPELVLHVVQEQAAALENPPQTTHDLLDRFERNGLTSTAVALRALIEP